MSMMYPNGQGIPGAGQFMTGGQPNYGAPLVNFGQQFQQGMNATRPQPQQQQPGAVSASSGPNSGGKAAGGAQPGDFAAKLRAFFTPGGQQPGSGTAQGGGFGPQGGAPGGQVAPGGGATGGPGFGGGAADGSPWPTGGPSNMNFGGAGF
jgi:translation initiation factor IF-2